MNVALIMNFQSLIIFQLTINQNFYLLIISNYKEFQIIKNFQFRMPITYLQYLCYANAKSIEYLCNIYDYIRTSRYTYYAYVWMSTSLRMSMQYIYICNIYTISMQYPHALPRKYAIELEPREASRRRASIRCGWRAAAERQAIPEYERTSHILPLPAPLLK